MSLFREQFVRVSASLGILGDVSALLIAGDGTPLRTPNIAPSLLCAAFGHADEQQRKPTQQHMSTDTLILTVVHGAQIHCLLQ
jgi:predicted phosphodiesterase